MPIVNRQVSFPILGRVALGYLKVTAEGKTYPAKSDTFVFSADDEAVLTHVARTLGGAVEPQPGADDAEPRWRVVTPVTELHVVLPSDDERSFSQWMERWGRGGLVRRCDGERCQFAIVDPAQLPLRDVPCICAEQSLPDEQRCDPTTRMNVVVKELLAIPHMGLWQVTSRGWDSSRELQAAVELLRAGGVVAGVPLRLAVEKRTRRTRDNKTYEFPVFTLVPLVSFLEIAQRAKAGAPRGFLPAGDESQPSLAPAADAPDRPDAEPTEATAGPAGGAPPGAGGEHAWADSFVKTAAQVPGADDLEKIRYLQNVCKEYVKGMGLEGTVRALWEQLGSPEKTLDDYRRLYAVLAAASIGVPLGTAVAGALRVLPREPVPF